jgi:hypothetical protein
MFMQKDDVKKVAPHVLSMDEYAKSLKKDEVTLVLRDYNEPTKAPYLSDGVEVFDLAKDKPPKKVKEQYGVKPNVPGINVVNALTAALGPGGYCMHISDGSYSGYTLWELHEFITKFDSTDLRVYISETFDCDDFSQVLQGNVNSFFPGIAFGTLWYGPNEPPWWGHSVNIFYSYTDDSVYLIEPQNDAIYSFNQKLWNPWMVIL